jgi:hypothetical protein
MIRRFALICSVLSAICLLISVGLGHLSFSFGVLFGILVGSADMLVLIWSIRSVFDAAKKRRAGIVTACFLLKFLFLAFIFYLLIVILRIDPLGLLTGFSISLISLIVTGIMTGTCALTDRKEQ